MKVDDPKFNIDDAGEVTTCYSCPIEQLSLHICGEWLWNHGRHCPTSETYAEACLFAESTEPEEP